MTRPAEETPDDALLTACSGPAILYREGDAVRVHPVDLRTHADVDRYSDWCLEHDATIVQQVDGEGLICAVMGCMEQATHAVVEYRGGELTQITGCPGHLAGVITTVLGVAEFGPQRPVWN